MKFAGSKLLLSLALLGVISLRAEGHRPASHIDRTPAHKRNDLSSDASTSLDLLKACEEDSAPGCGMIPLENTSAIAECLLARRPKSAGCRAHLIAFSRGKTPPHTLVDGANAYAGFDSVMYASYSDSDSESSYSTVATRLTGVKGRPTKPQLHDREQKKEETHNLRPPSRAGSRPSDTIPEIYPGHELRSNNRDRKSPFQRGSDHGTTHGVDSIHGSFRHPSEVNSNGRYMSHHFGRNDHSNNDHHQHQHHNNDDHHHNNNNNNAHHRVHLFAYACFGLCFMLQVALPVVLWRRRRNALALRQSGAASSPASPSSSPATTGSSGGDGGDSEYRLLVNADRAETADYGDDEIVVTGTPVNPPPSALV